MARPESLRNMGGGPKEDLTWTELMLVDKDQGLLQKPATEPPYWWMATMPQMGYTARRQACNQDDNCHYALAVT